MTVPIIDLFAGPGGLGEGFASLVQDQGRRAFKIALSIEKDQYAHRTLLLRAFFRQFTPGNAPGHYYDYLGGRLPIDQLFALHANEAEAAHGEAWQAELGNLVTPDSLVDERIQTALGKQSTWLLIGGPPCQAYSLVGRSRIRGASKQQYENDHRHYLYREYLRILAIHQPPVFVMENVKGLLSATVKDQLIFQQIVSDLRNPVAATSQTSAPVGYRLLSITVPPNNLFGEFEPEDFVVRSEQFGIPQARHRVIILGVREDIRFQPALLTPSPSPTVAEIIGDLPKLRSRLSKEFDSGRAWRDAVRSITNEKWFLKSALPSDLQAGIRAATRRLKANLSTGTESIETASKPASLAEWFFDPNVAGVVNHISRGHIREDLHRYIFAAVFAKKRGRSPLLEDFPEELLPNHLNVNQALVETKFNDRFRVQLENRPSTTIVSHIAKDGHYFIHYDPTQCRSLTVREAARLQTFPDNYYFEGPRTEQYKQVGNAVPPLLAHQLAGLVADLFEQYLNSSLSKSDGRINSATA